MIRFGGREHGMGCSLLSPYTRCWIKDPRSPSLGNVFGGVVCSQRFVFFLRGKLLVGRS